MPQQNNSFAIESVAARLVPFDFFSTQFNTVTDDHSIRAEQLTPPPGMTTDTSGRRRTGIIGTGTITTTSTTSPVQVSPEHPLYPIYATGGLMFPYMPAISEGIAVKYEAMEIIHSNEAYNAYRNTDNVRIGLSNAIWTCDTFQNARYTLAALHFFRSYSLMDFGAGKSGRPPSPMWFSAYGNYAFNKVPVLLERAEWSFPNDVDFVGIPEPGSTAWVQQQLATQGNTSANTSYTWLPIKFEISSISLIVQHAPKFWLGFSLEDYRSGKMLAQRGSFHASSAQGDNTVVTRILPTASVTPKTLPVTPPPAPGATPPKPTDTTFIGPAPASPFFDQAGRNFLLP